MINTTLAADTDRLVFQLRYFSDFLKFIELFFYILSYGIINQLVSFAVRNS